MSREAVLSPDSKKWTVDGATGTVTISDTALHQTVYIFKCAKATVIIKGKVASVAIDNCDETQVLMENVVGTVEVTNSKKIQFQVSGSCPSASVDKTVGCNIFLMSDDAKKCQLSTAQHSDVQITYMGKGDEMVEVPIPEQFVHTLGDDGKITSAVSELYG
ncbi:hypothetical protein CTAYLR_006722 [Chrysophaeum taylorii]|uniref:C-CAP/cofactor C-like domain-containing protein n=1 Tax=Chrysophaeum taylorii TaxID=2483200 RepID=A0AAD7XJC5_9STRA|nr:hypothetical protein CTAYLR_006722 [Chrysophaeum taylorii]